MAWSGHRVQAAISFAFLFVLIRSWGLYIFLFPYRLQASLHYSGTWWDGSGLKNTKQQTKETAWAAWVVLSGNANTFWTKQSEHRFVPACLCNTCWCEKFKISTIGPHPSIHWRHAKCCKENGEHQATSWKQTATWGISEMRHRTPQRKKISDK